MWAFFWLLSIVPAYMNISILYGFYSLCWEWSLAYPIGMYRPPILFFIRWEVVLSPHSSKIWFTPQNLLFCQAFLPHCLPDARSPFPSHVFAWSPYFLPSFLIYKALSISFLYSFFGYVDILPRQSFRGHWVCNLSTLFLFLGMDLYLEVKWWLGVWALRSDFPRSDASFAIYQLGNLRNHLSIINLNLLTHKMEWILRLSWVCWKSRFYFSFMADILLFSGC